MRSASSSTEHLERREVGRVVSHVIHEAARRGDDHVHARAQRTLLRIHRHAAVHRDARKTRVVRQSLDLVFNLDGQFTRRSEHKRPRGGLLQRFAPKEALQDRNEECRRFPCASLGTRDHVNAGHGQWDDTALNGPCLAPSQILDAAQEAIVQSEALERERCGIKKNRLVRAGARVPNDGVALH